ncbi:MAG TPA: NAD(P)H-binding protein [Croceibacterium sp.]|nr:NAD(P)H-binding protein [Croceibacterium sp.]
MTIAITGGTGFVGQAVIDLACRRGQPLRALARRAQAPCEGVEWVRGDLADGHALASLVHGADTVLHVAGVVNAPDAAGFHLGNVAGTQALVEAALQAGVRRFVLVSSLAAREPGLSQYGLSKRGAEEIVRASTLDWIIVRPPAIYGPRDREILDLFRAASWGVVPMPPHGRASMVHVDDLARLLLDLTTIAEIPAGNVFEPDDGHDGGWEHAELARMIGDAVGRKVRVPRLPAWALMAGARFDRLLRGKRAKLTADRVSYMVHPDWVSRRDMAPPANLWRADVPTPQGLAATAKWYREQHWL